MKLHTVFLTTAAFTALAACNPSPASDTPVAAAPPAAEIAAPATPSGPAAENTTDTLSSTPLADAAAPAAPAATPAPPAAAPPAAAAGPTKAELANGAAVYARTCAMCHGPSGEGTVMAVALTAGHEAAVVKEKVTKGMIKPGDKMPPIGAGMSAQDLNDVARFVEAGLPK